MTDERNTNDHDMDDKRIHERYRDASTEQPPEALDARILAAAREAVSESPATRGNWRPFAVAAVVLLSATLVVTMRPPAEQASAPAPVAAGDAAEPAEYAPEPAAAPAQRAVARQAETETLEEIVVTGSRVIADEDDVVAGITARPVAQSAERKQRMPAAAAEATRADVGAETAIEAIVAAWDAGDPAQAEQLLDAFAETYPDYPEADLRDALPAALLEDWPRQ